MPIRLFLFWWALSCVVGAEEAAEATAASGPDYAWLKAGFLVVLHLVSPALRPWLKKHMKVVGGFGAGMAISYVYIQLLPELSEQQHELGKFIYALVLVGFLLYLALERTDDASGLSVGGFWLYNWLLVYSLPPSESFSLVHSLLVATAVALHLLHQDFEFGHHNPEAFDKRWRYLLALAPLAGALSRHLYMSEHPGALLTALMAGRSCTRPLLRFLAMKATVRPAASPWEWSATPCC